MTNEQLCGSVLMPLRAFIDSETPLPAAMASGDSPVLMPLRAFIDSEFQSGVGRRPPPMGLNALTGIY